MHILHYSKGNQMELPTQSWQGTKALGRVEKFCRGWAVQFQNCAAPMHPFGDGDMR